MLIDRKRPHCDGPKRSCMLQCKIKVCMENERIRNRLHGIVRKSMKGRIYMVSFFKSISGGRDTKSLSGYRKETEHRNRKEC